MFCRFPRKLKKGGSSVVLIKSIPTSKKKAAIWRYWVHINCRANNEASCRCHHTYGQGDKAIWGDYVTLCYHSSVLTCGTLVIPNMFLRCKTDKMHLLSQVMEAMVCSRKGSWSMAQAEASINISSNFNFILNPWKSVTRSSLSQSKELWLFFIYILL